MAKQLCRPLRKPEAKPIMSKIVADVGKAALATLPGNSGPQLPDEIRKLFAAIDARYDKIEQHYTEIGQMYMEIRATRCWEQMGITAAQFWKQYGHTTDARVSQIIKATEYAMTQQAQGKPAPATEKEARRQLKARREAQRPLKRITKPMGRPAKPRDIAALNQEWVKGIFTTLTAKYKLDTETKANLKKALAQAADTVVQKFVEKLGG